MARFFKFIQNLIFESVEENNLVGIDGMTQKRERLLQRLNNLRRNKGWLVVLSIFMIVVITVIIFTETRIGKYSLLIAYSLLPLLLIPYFNQRIKEVEVDLRNLEVLIDLETYAADNKDLSYAEKTLRSHNNEIMKYHNMNLRQNSWIFMFGIICIILGFLIIIATFFAVNSISDDSTLQMELGIFGGIGSIMTNYIAALYLKMNSEVNGNMKEFHARLVDTHKILLGNLIATKITDEALRNQTLSEVAKEVSK